MSDTTLSVSDPGFAAAFNKAYYFSKPHEIRELLNGATGGTYTIDQVQGNSAGQHQVGDVPYTLQEDREKRAIELIGKGFTIDVPIMVWGWDPFKTTFLRSQYSFTWVPSAGQPNIQIAPGLTVPGSNLVPYDPNNMPSGAIKVSLNLADYPPYDEPVVVVVPVGVDPVGGWQGVGKLFYMAPGENYADGAKFTDARGTFLKHVYVNPFGRTGYWEKVA